jgi:hypothetical protein
LYFNVCMRLSYINTFLELGDNHFPQVDLQSLGITH